ncbi:MAG TPA: restriction endonuclease subunit S [Candidatus Paceibacterota bacterium]
MSYPTNPSTTAKLTTGHRKLGEVIELHYGKGLPKYNRKPDGEYPVYGANGILDYSDKFLLEGDAIIVGRKGSAGEVTRVSGKFWPSDVTYYVLGNSKIDIDYLFHALKNLSLQRLAVGVKPGINRNRVYELEIPLPPSAEQKKIVARLEGLLTKIKEAKRLRAEAQEAAQNLLPAELHKIFEEGKRKGWEGKELGEVVKMKTERNAKNDLPYVGMEDVESGSGRFLGSLEPKDVKSTTFIFDKDSLLYGKLRPYLNKAMLPDFEGHCTTEFMPIVPDRNILIREWLFYWITSGELVKRIFATSTGTRMPRANMKEVLKFKIPLPPIAEQKKIVARLDSLSEKTRQIQVLQSQTAQDFKDLEQSILHRAFTGELVK